jgi:cytochrome c oxidase subunit 2
LALLSLAACGGALSTLDPSGPAAASIAMMWRVMLIGATGSFALVMVLLAAGFLRPAGGPPASVGAWLGWGGVGFVSTVLLALLAYAFIVGERLAPTGVPGGVTITATAEQWRWRFDYGPLRSGGTEAVLVLPAGRPVIVQVTATDVIHSFWVPRLAGKIDAIPGHVNRLRVQAAAPGEYAGVCAEFCGIGHRSHGFMVLALDERGWDAFVGGMDPAELSPWTVP